MSSQPHYNDQPKFRLGELALYGGACVRILGYERFVPGDMWFYLLGAKVGKTKMRWHTRIPEFELVKPARDNLTDAAPRFGK